MFKGFIFDLDGVLVDTAKYHFLAWKAIAKKLEIAFGESKNEQLKGVSRTESLEKILTWGGLTLSDSEKQKLLFEKNKHYLSLVQEMKTDELLPDVRTFLAESKKAGIKISLASASKNAKMILDKTEITTHFDAIIDGTQTTHSKPNPEVFLKAAKALNLLPKECIVFEDAIAGIEGALNGGFFALGVGNPSQLKMAHHCIPNFTGKNPEYFQKLNF